MHIYWWIIIGLIVAILVVVFCLALSVPEWEKKRSDKAQEEWIRKYMGKANE